MCDSLTDCHYHLLLLGYEPTGVPFTLTVATANNVKLAVPLADTQTGRVAGDPTSPGSPGTGAGPPVAPPPSGAPIDVTISYSSPATLLFESFRSYGSLTLSLSGTGASLCDMILATAPVDSWLSEAEWAESRRSMVAFPSPMSILVGSADSYACNSLENCHYFIRVSTVSGTNSNVRVTVTTSSGTNVNLRLISLQSSPRTQALTVPLASAGPSSYYAFEANGDHGAVTVEAGVLSGVGPGLWLIQVLSLIHI